MVDGLDHAVDDESEQLMYTAGTVADSEETPGRGDVPVRDQAPLKAPLAFRVGVVGHRPHRLRNTEVLRTTLGDILATIGDELERTPGSQRQLYDDRSARLIAVSPLAEGTDRIFAEAALERDAELCCVMPFARKEYELNLSTR